MTDSPEYLAEHVRGALATDERVSELGLTVTIRGDRVHVSGPVSTPDRRDAIGAVVAEHAPGLTLRNETTLVDLSGTDVETLS